MLERLPVALLDPDALLRGSVVANCAMNRDRALLGVNSYARELGCGAELHRPASG